MPRMKEIIAKYGEEFVLRQLAEASSGLAQAALMLIGSNNKETPMRKEEARERLVERIADVHLYAGTVFREMLNMSEQSTVDVICEIKAERLFDRLLDGKMEEDVW